MPKARARNPIAKRIWLPVNAKKFWFGYDVTSVRPFVPPHPYVRNPTMLMRLCLFGGQLHGKMRLRKTTEMLKNTKYKVSLYVFVGYDDKSGKKRKREKKKTKKAEMIKQSST